MYAHLALRGQPLRAAKLLCSVRFVSNLYGYILYGVKHLYFLHVYMCHVVVSVCDVCQAMDAEAAVRSPFSPARHKRKESKGTRARKSHSRDRRRRQRSETKRSESSDDKRRRRRSPSHVRRGREGDRERSDVPEGRESRTSSMQDGKSKVQAAEPVTDPDRPPCEHCGQPLTKHLSGRKQHQWMSIPCLTYQFFNQMTKKERDQEGAWARAQKDAKGLHKKRVEEGGRAPHPARP